MTTRRLTKRRALEICSELWTWLAETGSPDKAEWPGWGRVGAMCQDCPCCAYAIGNCSRCPLMGYAWSDLCLQYPSPYWDWIDWRYENLARSKNAARRIVAACDKALADLPKPKRRVKK